MVEDCLNLLTLAISSVSEWFVAILTSTQTVSYYLTMMFVALLFSYLLAPVLRSSGSDRAGRKNEKDDI